MVNLLIFLTPKSETLYLSHNSTVRQILENFDVHKFSVVPLIDDDGFFVSTISEGDVLRFIKNSCKFDISIAEKTKVKDIELYRSYKALPISTPMDEVVRLALEQNFIPIVDDRGVYIGIVKRKSIIDFLLSKINLS